MAHSSGHAEPGETGLHRRDRGYHHTADPGTLRDICAAGTCAAGGGEDRLRPGVRLRVRVAPGRAPDYVMATYAWRRRRA
jgi:hypothetical protein